MSSTRLGLAIAEALVAAGIEEVVVCPGSRSTAITVGLASLAFSAYLGSFNSYNRVYGSIGAVVALLMWFYLGAFSVMLGAIFNVELRRRRRVAAAREARRSLREQVQRAG